jgi:hypothetical protein
MHCVMQMEGEEDVRLSLLHSPSKLMKKLHIEYYKVRLFSPEIVHRGLECCWD